MDEGVAQLFVNQFNGRKIIGTVEQLQLRWSSIVCWMNNVLSLGTDKPIQSLLDWKKMPKKQSIQET